MDSKVAKLFMLEGLVEPLYLKVILGVLALKKYRYVLNLGRPFKSQSEFTSVVRTRF